MDDNPETLPLYVKISQNHHRLRLDGVVKSSQHAT
jgi:hypothetical protein